MFPSIITSFPLPTASSRLNSPSHSALHNLQSSTIGQIEAIIGLSGNSSTLGTLIGDLRSPASNGGGHIQTANKGGTGQTVFTKGDILVATNSSTLSKLAVGTDGQAVIADSSQGLGIRYGNVVSNKITVRTSVTAFTGGAASVANVLFVSSIAGSILGSNNAIRFTGVLDTLLFSGSNSLNIDLQYGGKSVAGIQLTATGASNLRGTVEGMIVANGSTGDQKGYIVLKAGNGLVGGGAGNASVIQGFASGASSVNSSANQDLFINASIDNNGGTAHSIVGTIFVVEKIA